jgi:predicted enzyme related to lactoylglutathione lyase
MSIAADSNRRYGREVGRVVLRAARRVGTTYAVFVLVSAVRLNLQRNTSRPTRERSLAMANVINWFEIPVADFERAKKFYSDILGGPLHTETMGDHLMGFLPMEGEGVGGAIVHGEGYTPSSDGTMVYLDGGDDLMLIINRVEAAGGTVVVPKTLITEEIGYFAVFLDTEGNKVAVHSRS